MTEYVQPTDRGCSLGCFRVLFVLSLMLNCFLLFFMVLSVFFESPFQKLHVVESAQSPDGTWRVDLCIRGDAVYAVVHTHKARTQTLLGSHDDPIDYERYRQITVTNTEARLNSPGDPPSEHDVVFLKPQLYPDPPRKTPSTP